MELLEKFRNRRVVVIGDLMLDQYLWGAVSRISPEAPVPVVREVRRSAVPGGAANVAANAAALGADVKLYGVTGDDIEGTHLQDLLAAAGVDASAVVRDPTRPTTTKTRIVAESQQVVRVDRECVSPFPSQLEASLASAAATDLRGADACIISDYAKGSLTHTVIRTVIEAGLRYQCPVVIDPKGVDFRRYEGATILTPNAQEAAAAAHDAPHPILDIYDIGATLLRLLPGTVILVTRGADGVALFKPHAKPLLLSSIAQQVYDVTGAGDTLVATLAVALAAGAGIEAAALVGNFAAGMSVGRFGTVSIGLDDLVSAAQRNPTAFTPVDMSDSAVNPQQAVPQ